MNTSNEHVIQLWYVSRELIQSEELLEGYRNWLSPHERKRYEGFAIDDQAHEYLISRALLRYVLSQYVLGVQPSDWMFVADENGKPRLAEGFAHLDLHFNLSHSGDLVVLAVSQGIELGVDVELIRRPVFNMAMAEHYFANSEIQHLQFLPTYLQVERIAEFWTLKEACLKASGLGLRVPLSQLEVSIDDSAALTVDFLLPFREEIPQAADWQVWLYRLGEDYRIAVCSSANLTSCHTEIVINEWKPKGLSFGYECHLLRN